MLFEPKGAPRARAWTERAPRNVRWMWGKTKLRPSSVHLGPCWKRIEQYRALFGASWTFRSRLGAVVGNFNFFFFLLALWTRVSPQPILAGVLVGQTPCDMQSKSPRKRARPATAGAGHPFGGRGRRPKPRRGREEEPQNGAGGDHGTPHEETPQTPQEETREERRGPFFSSLSPATGKPAGQTPPEGQTP